MWWRLRSGPVITPHGAGSGLGEACFVCMVGSDRKWRGQEKKSPRKKVRILSVPGCRSAQISAEQWGAAKEDEVATGVWHVFPPMLVGVVRKEREERCD